MDQDNQRFNYPFPGSSSVSEESPSSSPRPASFMGKGKQEVRPHVAAPAPPDGPSPTPRGIMAHLRAAAAGLKASRLSRVVGTYGACIRNSIRVPISSLPETLLHLVTSRELVCNSLTLLYHSFE